MRGLWPPCQALKSLLLLKIYFRTHLLIEAVTGVEIRGTGLRKILPKIKVWIGLLVEKVSTLKLLGEYNIHTFFCRPHALLPAPPPDLHIAPDLAPHPAPHLAYPAVLLQPQTRPLQQTRKNPPLLASRSWPALGPARI